MADGAELIEEGAGFGVPIAKYADRTYFSTSAEVFLMKLSPNEAVVSKVFFLDAVSEKQVGSISINHGFYSLFHSGFERAYLYSKSLRPFFDGIMRLRKAVGLQTRFMKVEPKGMVAVTYRCCPSLIRVHVELSTLEKANCQEILILNEQGAAFFRKYSDSDGAMLCDGQIGAWAEVKAKQAAFSDLEAQLSFSLEDMRSAKLFRGREQIKDRFSWAGLSYALHPHTSSFDYTIRISEPRRASVQR